MNILGISCYFHDASAALLQDGRLIAAAEEERFTRKKHDYEFPQNAIDFCLKAGGLHSTDLDYVAFFEKPFVKFERLLLSSMQTFPRSHRVFREAMITWLGDKLWIKTLIQKRLGVAPSKILFSEHHLSHAASAFLCSPFEEAGILTVDGVGEWTTASMGIGKGRTSSCSKKSAFPILWGFSTVPSRHFSASRSTRESTRLWAWRHSGCPSTRTRYINSSEWRTIAVSSLIWTISLFTTRRSRHSIRNLSTCLVLRATRALYFSRPTPAIRLTSGISREMMTSLERRINITRTLLQVSKPSPKKFCSHGSPDS